jgi:DNA mismatch repair protein MutL
MGRIAVLPTVLANQIAAGEVIERPASVVKELVENAIDAHAKRISVSVSEGGRERIVVRDDGDGMGRDDAQLAFARHATSKIKNLGDLEGIASFGFRGEALASIAAAADVDLVTRRRDDEVGTCVRARNGTVADVIESGGAPGTQIDVCDLFAALPARRKFLKRAATEFGHIAEAISRTALSAPHIGFTLTHGERTVLSLPAVEHRQDRIMQVVGTDASRGMLRVEAQTPTATLEAYCGRPDQSLSSARLVLTYVDGRFVRDRVLTRAILNGYESVLMRGRYPVVVVFLTLQAGEVDVNVHPAKSEVRFRDSSQIHRLVAGGIASRLRDRVGAEPPVRTDSDRALRLVSIPPSRATAALAGAPDRQVGETRATYGAPPGSGESRPPAALTGEGLTVPLRDGITPPVGFFGGLRYLGQVLDGYLVCASPRSLVLIDQHAAHERVRFEQLQTQLEAGGVPVQRLLVPESLSVGLAGAQMLHEAREALARLGFEGEPFGDGVYLLRAIPSMLAEAHCGAVLRDVAAECTETGVSRAIDEAVETLLASVACHSAIRVGRSLEHTQVHALLQEMDRIDLAGYCPHGRPAFAEFDAGALERLFKR